MLPDLQSVIRLQDLDNRVGELTREISALPGHISEIEKKLESHQRKLDADRAALSANQKERKKAEIDIQTQEQKISKLKGQMLEAKTNEIYKAFQNEIEFCEKEIRGREDRILELMTESEPLEKNVKAAEIALGEEKKQVEAEKQGARERTAVDQKALDELNVERVQELRANSQDPQGCGGGRSHRWPLLYVSHGYAPAVFPGLAKGRSGDGVRELRTNHVLQPTDSCGRRRLRSSTTGQFAIRYAAAALLLLLAGAVWRAAEGQIIQPGLGDQMMGRPR
jgi:predicted  nucleic acid-binding Zn-ribbon protein